LAAPIDALTAGRKQPAIARGSALSLLAAFAPLPTDVAVDAGLKDASPLVRRAAADALANSHLRENANIPASLLNDPVRSVRIEAAEILADAGPARFSADSARATDEYVAAQQLDADRPEAHMNLALLFVREGKPDRAEAELKTALSLGPSFTPATVNLADLYRQLGRDPEGEAVLRQALERSPNEPSLLLAGPLDDPSKT
jgi:tetratricopeptide (TPR) repeat protein